MANKYFDSKTYPWHIREARALHEVLYAQIPMPGEIELIRASCGQYVKQIAQGAPDAMWRGLLDAVAIGGYLRNLDKVLRERHLPHVHTALDSLAHAVFSDSECWILEQCIFVNRIRLRKALETLAGANTTERVLLVRGEKASGKTWTRHIITHFARKTGQKCIYIYSGIAPTVKEVVNHICIALGGTAPENFSTDSAWYRQVGLQMTALAQARGCGAWIIMDDLGVDESNTFLVDPEIRNFFDILGLFIPNPEFAQWFRLILISYPDGRPILWKDECFMEDQTAVSDLKEAEIEGYLLNWAQQNDKRLTQEQASMLAAAVMQKALAPCTGNDMRSQLTRVHDELYSVLETL